MKALAFALSAALALTFAACSSNQSGTSSGGQTSSTTGSISQATKDSTLTAKVKSALAADVGLSTLNINVDSSGNTVTLKGNVDSADKKKRAEEVARKVDGVATVRNELVVKSGS